MKVLLYSGGLDSWLMSKLWEPDVKLYVNVGSLGSKEEIKHLDEDVVVTDLDLSRFEIPERNYLLPLRNLYFCMLAANYGDEICLGATASSTNLDKTKKFCKLASKILTYLSPQIYGEKKKIKVVIPYHKYSKTELLRMYKEKGGDLRYAWTSTHSCYNPKKDGSDCGECTSCLKKRKAFKENGFDYEKDL